MKFIVYSRGFAAALQKDIPPVILEQFIHPVSGLQQMVVEHPVDEMEIEHFIELHDAGDLEFEIEGIDSFRRLLLHKDPRIKAMIAVFEVDGTGGPSWWVFLAYAYVPKQYLKWLSISACRRGGLFNDR